MRIYRSIVVAIFEVSSILPYDAVYRPQCYQLSKALEADYGSTSDEKQWLNFDLKWLKIKHSQDQGISWLTN